MSLKLDNIFKKSKRIEIDNSSKLVIMSDCHRGVGDTNDAFLKNKNIYELALLYYYNKGYTYIELGDGDEMWKVDNYKNIIIKNIDSFKLLKRFHDDGRLIMLYGNHDIFKRDSCFLEEYFYKYYSNSLIKEQELLNNLTVYEGIVLCYMGKDIFLIHGHQVDFINSRLWRLTHFVVNNIWNFFGYIGLKVNNYNIKNNYVINVTEKKLKKWCKDNNKIIIAGHTHNSVFPKDEQPPYFNDGSCVQNDGITCIEIENGKISLIKWEFKIKQNSLMSIKRLILDGDKQIVDFFK